MTDSQFSFTLFRCYNSTFSGWPNTSIETNLPTAEDQQGLESILNKSNSLHSPSIITPPRHTITSEQYNTCHTHQTSEVGQLSSIMNLSHTGSTLLPKQAMYERLRPHFRLQGNSQRNRMWTSLQKLCWICRLPDVVDDLVTEALVFVSVIGHWKHIVAWLSGFVDQIRNQK